MAYQQVQFEFPDPDKAEAADRGVKEKDNGDFEITIEGRSDPLKEDKPAKPEKAEKEESDLDIEVIDDRSEDDRGKQKSKAPMELTDDEMEDLIPARSPELRTLLDKAWADIEAGRGLEHDDFWRQFYPELSGS